MKEEHRETCYRCMRPKVVCYCSHLNRIPWYPVLILMHPKEARKGINTGRMAHLSLERSYLATGIDFTSDSRVLNMMAQHRGTTYLVFPGEGSLTVAECATAIKGSVGEPLFIIIDGTWPQAKKMLRLNPFLVDLPRVCFHPDKPSTYTIRKQPNSQCYSTVECLQYLVSNLSTKSTTANILTAFDHMVRQQVFYEDRG